MTERRTNWAGNVTFAADSWHRPDTVVQLQRLVAATDRVRAVGTRHSFSSVADTTGTLVSLDAMEPILRIDPDQATVTVSAGMRYGELATRLHCAGYALANLASLPHISVAGACATGTHGSGDGNGSLATAVSALELVTADGDLVRLSRQADGDRFAGAVVQLGALGVITAVTLDLVPTFEVAQHVFTGLPFDELQAHSAEIFAAAYSVSLFTEWTGSSIKQAWCKHHVRAGEPRPSSLVRWGAAAATTELHPIAGFDPTNCTGQLGVAGPWHHRLPHFRLDFLASTGDELQSEFFVSREHGAAALAALYEIQDRFAPLVQVSELRTIAADDLWLSPMYRRDSLAIHITWVSDVPAVTAAVALIEQALAPFTPRPHWGKVFTLRPAQVAAAYPRLAQFAALVREFDPAGKFGNDLIDQYIHQVEASTSSVT